MEIIILPSPAEVGKLAARRIAQLIQRDPATVLGLATGSSPLAIYAEFEVNFDVTLAISALLVLISAVLLISLKLTSLWQPSEQISPSRFARLSWS